MDPLNPQAGLHLWQQRRAHASAQQGALRIETFHVPVEGAELVEGYAVGEEEALFVSMVRGVATCNFGVAFTEKPIMVSDVALQHEDTDGTVGQAWDEAFTPVLLPCVVNWKRAADAWLFLGADVQFRVHDHPFESRMMVRLQFIGNSIITPNAGVMDTVDTTTMWVDEEP